MNLQLALNNVYGARLLVKRINNDDRARQRRPENTIFNNIYYKIPPSEQNDNYEIAAFDSILNKLPMNTVFMYITVLPNDFPDFRGLTIDNSEPEINTNNGTNGVKKVNTKDYSPPQKKRKNNEKRSIFKPLSDALFINTNIKESDKEEIKDEPIEQDKIIISDQPDTDFIDQAISDYLPTLIQQILQFYNQTTEEPKESYDNISTNRLLKRIIYKYYPHLPSVVALTEMYNNSVARLDITDRETMISTFEQRNDNDS